MNVLDIIKSSLFTFISSLARNLIGIGLSWLASRRLIDAGTSSQVGTFGSLAVVAVAWSFLEKYIFAKANIAKILAALSLPQGASLAHLDEELRKKN